MGKINFNNLVTNRYKTFCEELIGQEEVKAKFESVFKQIYYDEKYGGNEDSVLSSVFLCGPSGSGKSFFAQAMAKAIHGSARHILRINCNEFVSDHETARLVGAPPGYLGHRETQPLLSQARVNAVQSENSKVIIILWDEIEKAAPKFSDLIMQILDRGTLRVGDNSLVNFQNTVNLFTTNAGYNYKESSFMNPDGPKKDVDQMTALKKAFRPEFLNRIGNFFYFKPFSEDETLQLFYRMLTQRFFPIRRASTMIDARLHKIILTPACINHFLPQMKDKVMGARKMKYLIDNQFYIWGAEAIEKNLEALPEDFDIVFDYREKTGKVHIKITETNEDKQSRIAP